MAYYDEEEAGTLRVAVADAVAEWPGVTEERTFGCPSFRVDGTLFAVVVTEGVVLTRLPPDARADLDELFETGPFRPGDRTIAAWVQVDVDPANVDALVPFVRRSYETARRG